MVSDPVAATDWRQLASDTKLADGMFIDGERRAAVDGSTGEMCTAGSRLVVHADVADRVVARIVGGVRLSGFGRDKSRHALEEYTYFKTTWIRYA